MNGFKFKKIIAELMFDSDSDDEQFEGSLATNLNNNNNNNNVYDDVTLTERK